MENTKIDSHIPVVFSPAADDACAFYRMRIPHLNLPLSDYYFTGWKSDGTPNQLDFRRVLGRKVAIVQRQASIHNLKAMQNMKALGLKIIYDLDDNIWDIPHGNPAKKPFEEHKAGFVMCADAADLITVSTQGLKTAAGMSLTSKEIIIIPNAIDFNLFQKKEIERDDGVVIGWGGSNTHTDDVKDVFDLLPEILNQCPQTVMEIVGAPPKKEAKQQVVVIDILKREEVMPNDSQRGTQAEPGDAHPEENAVKKMVPYALLVEDIKTKQREEVPWNSFKRSDRILKGRILRRDVLVDSALASHPQYRFKMWAPIREYPNRLSSWAWDIAIAPLEDYRFNKSKSSIKMLEAAALQIPCLVSNIQPYFEFCSLGGEDLKWLLCSKLEDWKSKLITLINEPGRRQYLGKKMYDTAKRYFDIENVKANWEHAFRKVLQ